MFRGLNLTKHCNDTVMLKKFQNLKESAPGLAIDARILEFLSITVFREFQVWKFWNF